MIRTILSAPVADEHLSDLSLPLLRASWGDLLGTPGGLWALLGAFWGSLGNLLELLGDLLGPSWALLSVCAHVRAHAA